MNRSKSATIVPAIVVLLAIAGLPLCGGTDEAPPPDYRNALSAIRNGSDMEGLDPRGILAAALTFANLDRRVSGWLIFLASDYRPDGLLRKLNSGPAVADNTATSKNQSNTGSVNRAP